MYLDLVLEHYKLLVFQIFDFFLVFSPRALSQWFHFFYLFFIFFKTEGQEGDPLGACVPALQLMVMTHNDSYKSKTERGPRAPVQNRQIRELIIARKT